MPANLTPDYQHAERRYRDAHDDAEKLAALEEMLRTLPKHKGTEKIQADLKRKISEARRASVTAKKHSGKDPFHVPKQGAGQVALLGVPNVGKSALVQALTDAPVKVADFPFSTHGPVPGMAYYEDVPIQLLDLPPLTPEHVPGGMVGAIRNADLLAIMANASRDSVLEDFDAVLRILIERHIQPVRSLAVPDDETSEALPMRALLIATGMDAPAAAENLATTRELLDVDLPLVAVSCTTREHFDDLMRTLFEMLQVIRIYAKPPGKPPDMSAPFLLAVGSTVRDLADHIHKDFAEGLKFARIWGASSFDGQQVHHEHVLTDKDVVELHV
jgi:ribosome-interacting GTPase 1